MKDLLKRIGDLDWQAITAAIDAQGYAATGRLLSASDCQTIAGWYSDDSMFRSRIIMARHGFGSGEYKYFAAPLPEPIATLRSALYPRLAPLANRWAERLRQPQRYPATHRAYLAQCHEAGQTRPTPLLLRYQPGDFNCLHQDLYGELSFPFQVVFQLSEGFTGGELVLVEQRPRQQSRVEVLTPAHGEAVIFTVNHRPVSGTRGDYRVAVRHGVSRLRSGERFTAGIIFHDAK